MRLAFIGLAAVTMAGVAACAPTPPATPGGATTATPRDTGNMAFPAPLPQGNISTTMPNRPSATSTTGNMAYPAPLPDGTITTRRPTP